MAFNLPTYTGGQLAHPTTIPQNVTPGNPTDQEYSDAIIYTSDVINCYRYGDGSCSDVASASDFMFQVGNARLQGAPAWANQLMNLVNQRFNQLEIDVAQTYNTSCGDGITRPWKIVNDINGVDPTTQNLPALRNRNDVTALDNNNADAYIAFYQINVPANAVVTRKRTEIAKYLGASFVGLPL